MPTPHVRLGKPPWFVGRTSSVSIRLTWITLLTLASASAPRHAASDEPTARDGFRRLAGRHLVLWTDVASRRDVDELPAVFDQAIEQLAHYFRVPAERWQDWQVRGYVMANPGRFRRAGLLHDRLPDFEFGYQRGDQLWVYDQPSPYYRRHLLIHEGVHAFMSHFLGGTGPTWYREGMADLLATHHWGESKLVLNRWPPNRRLVTDWGRIKVIREAVERGQSLSVRQVMALPARRFHGVEAYAWAWALCAFLDAHPHWQAIFRQLPDRLDQDPAKFNVSALSELRQVAVPLNEAWQLYLAEMDYGYAVAEDVIHYRSSAQSIVDRSSTKITFRVQTDRGWQSTGWLLEPGLTYQLSVTGRYHLNREQPPWPCEAGGVTLRYHQGRPLGMLLMALRTVGEPTGRSPLLKPESLGLGRSVVVPRQQELFVRINELAGQRGDNWGELRLQIQVAVASGAQAADQTD